MNLVVRTDANVKIGTGHLMRCLALAQAWQAEGGHAVCLSHCESEALRQRVEEANITFIPLDKPHPDSSDFQRTISILRKLQADWLVLDGYHFDPAYQQAIRAAGYRLLVIDDIAHWPEYHADVLLNQNINAGQLAYMCDPDTTLLLGTRYALLRREFLEWRGWQREISGVARKVLVALGGNDPDNVTIKVIQALQQVNVPGLEAKIVVGPVNPNLDTLLRAIQNSNGNLQLLTTVTNMPELMAWADMAVSAGGSTCWELAFMGVPSILLVLAENQNRIAEGLDQAGIVINLGWFDRISESEIAGSLTNLLSEREWRHRMSQLGQQLADGCGARRVIEALRFAIALGER
jgi:UDP-2,4-diacetamido-2,4,6-trideoxy-beta-L-altropyranose hydrolase